VNRASGKRSETLIFYAIRYGLGLERIRNLVSLGADVNFKNTIGLTPLSLASSICSTELVKLLLDSGAFVNSRDIQGKSPLHYIVEAKFGAASEVLEIVSLFVQCGADVNSRDSSGYTPLYRAVSKEWTWETAGELIKAGADRCAMLYDGKYLYDMVKAGPWAETQRLFLRHYPV
jgi:ankyrin repeat protein